jgi:DNA glycosylase AlkZ-like
MSTIPEEFLSDYRNRTYKSLPELRLSTREQAVNFVNERGFIFFWPISGIVLPSLWVAVAGDRPVADAHDDPGHITWGWKDELLGQRQWYYAKILRKRGTMISLEAVPYFYALSENYGAYEEDYLTQYEQGHLTQEAKIVYETILDNGAMDTVALRKAAHLSSRENESRFNRALADLQADFKLAPVAVTQAGGWHYAFAYDIVARHYPDIAEQAHNISEDEAHLKLSELYLRSVGAVQVGDLSKLFGWKSFEIKRTVEQLNQRGLVHIDVQIEKHPGRWLVLADLLTSEVV